ncbi:UPF0481 protein At3g47200-like [Aristolochia californica]|uniref:UPF0481 protein At3g47200-like n=1 Tax=Aristolochia californica TaxID=171875 RepID=UPI0035DB4331
MAKDGAAGDWLVNISGFEEGLLEDVKSSFLGRIARNPSTTIYFVPQTLSQLKPDAYKSRFIPLAIHFKFDSLFPQGKIKNKHVLYHVQSILQRNPDRSFEDYLKAMNEMKDRIEKCHIEGYVVDFKRLLIAVFSGCFIVDNLLLFYEGKLTTAVDEICATRFQYLWVDLLLLENQVPFFVLQRVFDMVVANDNDSHYPSLVNLCLHFFNPFLEITKLQRPPMESESIHHLLHLVHHYLLPSENPPTPRNHLKILKPILTKLKNLWPSAPPPQNPISLENPTFETLTIKAIPSAKRVQDAGIKIRKKEGTGFSAICFNKNRGLLEIPHLHIDNNTDILLRNLVAWEQCHPDAGQFFTGYAIFMDYIINSSKDVEILLQNGIIEQSLGSDEEVASIFNGLSTNLVYKRMEGSDLPVLCNHINEYCLNDFNIWRAKLMADYFSNPWTIVSVIAAGILLLLTLTQTFFSTYSYFRPP